MEARLQEVQYKGMNEGYTPNLHKEEVDLNSKIEEWERQEEIIWHKKYRIKWLKEG